MSLARWSIFSKTPYAKRLRLSTSEVSHVPLQCDGPRAASSEPAVWLVAVRGTGIIQMNRDDWINHVVKAYKEAGRDTTGLRDSLCQKAAPQPREDTMQRTMRLPKGNLSGEQKKLVESLLEPLTAYVFQKVGRGDTFGPVTKPQRMYGKKMDLVLKKGSPEYKQVATVLLTFFAELDDLPEAYHSLVLYHTLKKVEIMLRNVFLPSSDTLRSSPEQRVRKMRRLLEAYAPGIDRKAFFKRNPLFVIKRSRMGCLPASTAILCFFLLTLVLLFM